jgi:Ca2+-binding RTX toxin-like protein
MDASGTDLLDPRGTAFYTMDASGTDLMIDYVTRNGEVHATGFSVTTADGQTLTARYADAQPLGFTTWSSTSSSVFQTLFDDTRLDLRGSNGDDSAFGTDLGDRFRMGAGDDTVDGGAGDDQINGGPGNDVLVSGTGDDVLIGGRGHDALIFEGAAGDMARGRGGAGNDVFIDASEGQTTWEGGAGHDLFVIGACGTALTAQIDGFAPTGTSGRTVITDFNAEDVLVFTGVQTTMGGYPDAIWTDMRPDAILADWDGAGADEFVFRDTEAGLQIGWGDEEVMLAGVTSKDVALDQIHFGGNWIDFEFDNGVIAHSPSGSTLAVQDGDDSSPIRAGLVGETWDSIMFETLTANLVLCPDMMA